MLFMIIERFREQDSKAIHQRLENKGRMAPEDLTYIDSWVQTDLDRWFQLMECDDIGHLQQWVTNWQDLIEFEIFPVQMGSDTADAIGPLLE